MDMKRKVSFIEVVDVNCKSGPNGLQKVVEMDYKKPSAIIIKWSWLFSNVENHAKRLQKEKYVSLPTNQEILTGIVSQFRSVEDNKSINYKEGRDGCDKFTTAPIYDVFFDKTEKTLQFIIIRKKYHLFCCLPLKTECDLKNSESTLGLEILMSITEFLDPLSRDTNAEDPKFIDLDTFLDVAIPLGRPIDMDPSVVRDKLQNKTVNHQLQTRQPAWKPILPHKVKSHTSIIITESVKSVQYDRTEVPDVVDLFGSISCHSLLEGPTTEVTLTLTHDDPKLKLSLENLAFHPCVSSIDKLGSDCHKLRFMPPNYKFVLCSYVLPQINEMPICGVFKMRGHKIVDFLLQLKLGSRSKNSFEYFEVTIPFFNRGKITQADLRPTCGMANVSQQRQSIVWNVGYKFPNKTLDVSLKGTVVFDFNVPVDHHPSDEEDPFVSFCVGLNCYAKLSFRTKMFVYSLCNIDVKNVHLSSDFKHKFSIDRIFESSDCKIWNSYGDVPSLVVKKRL